MGAKHGGTRGIPEERFSLVIVLTAFEAIPGAGTEAGLAWNWGQAYAAAGHAVTVLTSAGEDMRERANLWQDAGIEVVFLGGGGVARAPQKPRDFLAAALEIHRWGSACRRWLEANADSVTAVHHVSWGSVRLQPPFLKVGYPLKTVWGPLGGGQLAKFSGLLPRHRIHEFVRAASFPVGWLMRRCDFFMHGRPTVALATNSATFRYIESLGIGSAIKMLADGVHSNIILTDSPKSWNGNHVKLMWLGRMVASKRPDVSLKLIAELESRGIPASLTMIGDGPERASLEALAGSLRIGHLVEFVGRIPWECTFDYYDRSDFLVFTSMRDSSCPAVLEAAARGLPTLCLRHQGVGSMIPNSVAFGPSTFKSISDLVSRLADLVISFRSDVSSYQRASGSAVAFAGTQTWNAKVDFVLAEIDRA